MQEIISWRVLIVQLVHKSPAELVPPTSSLRLHRLEQLSMLGMRSMMLMHIQEYENIGLLTLELVLLRY